MPRILILACVLCLTACAATPRDSAPRAGHPADPDAPTAAAPPAPAEPAAAEPAHAHDHAGAAHDHAGAPHGDAAPPPAPAGAAYACPMHPGVTSNNPEDRCPECGMKINKKIAPEGSK